MQRELDGPIGHMGGGHGRLDADPACGQPSSMELVLQHALQS